MADSSIDAFLAFHVDEQGVRQIADELTSRGIAVYVWPSDARDQWQERETERLQSAMVVVIFLGAKGWGPYHAKLAMEARRLNKHIVFALIGELSADAKNEANRRFPNQQWLDLTNFSSNSVEILASAITRYLRRHSTFKPAIAGYTSDTIDAAPDYLDIREDVLTLTAVMLAKEVAPPLAIGLFGDWGSGKSYFMQAMRKSIEGLSNRAKHESESNFCSNIVSIEFNAWHYADTNLWASLVTHILENLARYVVPNVPPEEKLAVLIKELTSAKAVESQFNAEKQLAEKQITDQQLSLQKLRFERHQKEIDLNSLRLTDLASLFSENLTLKNEIKEALEKIGAPAALSSVADFRQLISDINTLRGRVIALLAGLARPKNSWIVGALVVALLIIPWISELAQQYLAAGVVEHLVWITKISAIAGSTLVVGRNAVKHVTDTLNKLESAKSRVDEILHKKRSDPVGEEAILEKRIVELKTEEEGARSRLAAATTKVIHLEERIASLKESQSLTRFLTERIESDDYRKHLGLISTIRQDFDSLATRLDSASSESVGGLTRIDRIVLYIDDLDRCPASKVVDVLQAVHLLLAYRLFVVVVGVDPRWLLHSLNEIYPAFGKETESTNTNVDLWKTTPQNYLEKIFQISINLRPMSADGYARLIQGLFSSDATLRAKGRQPSPSRASTEAATPFDTLNQDASGAYYADMFAEKSLTITSMETAFAESLFRLIPSPRAAKRFSNIYIEL